MRGAHLCLNWLFLLDFIFGAMTWSELRPGLQQLSWFLPIL